MYGFDWVDKIMIGNILDASDGNSNLNEGTAAEKDQDLLIEISNMEQKCEANEHLGALDANDDKESIVCHTKFDTESFINLLVEFQNHIIRFAIFIPENPHCYASLSPNE